ncbi:YgeY family selenium metabolism-linked hydrolase, partial [Enterococcus faecalis]
IRNLPAVKKYGDDVTGSMYNYDPPSYTHLTYEIECYFPTSVIPQNHDVTKAFMQADKNLYGETPKASVETGEMRKE